MTTILPGLMLGVLAASAWGQTSRADSGSSMRIAIRAARVLDPGSKTMRTDMVVRVDGRRIAAVLPASEYRPRPDEQLLDLGNATLLPGLIDAHVHFSIGGPARTLAATTLNAGFTTVADLGARTQRIQAVRDSIASGAWDGPRVLAAGLWIGVKGGVCEFGGIGVSGDAEAFRARVRENVAAGADLIKACVTGWPAVAWSHPDSAELSPVILGAIVDEAHKAGRKVVAHALSAAGVRRSLDAGVDGLVHAAYIDEALARRMRDEGMWLIPTLASLTAGDTSRASRGLADAVLLAHRAGVTLVYGTDGGVLPHGENAKEALALQAAGIPPVDILRMMTSSAAKALGISDSVGTIAPGMIADLVAVAGDPEKDLATLLEPVFVMARGKIAKRP